MTSTTSPAHQARIAAHEQAAINARSQAIATARQTSSSSSSPPPPAPRWAITPTPPRPAPIRPTAPKLHSPAASSTTSRRRPPVNTRRSYRSPQSQQPIDIDLDESDEQTLWAEDLEFAHAVWRAEALATRKGEALAAQSHSLNPDRDVDAESAFQQESTMSEPIVDDKPPPPEVEMDQMDSDDFLTSPEELRALQFLAQAQERPTSAFGAALSTSAPAQMAGVMETISDPGHTGAAMWLD